MFLPDVNVWVALAFGRHVHHAAANTWYKSSGDTCCFCRWTQQGFLRLSTNPAALPDLAVSLKQAWMLYDTMLDDPRIAFADEPAGIETQWRGYTQRRTLSPKVWGDAYVAAFAHAASLDLVTSTRACASTGVLTSFFCGSAHALVIESRTCLTQSVIVVRALDVR